MTRRSYLRSIIALSAAACILGTVAPASAAPSDKEVQKSIKTVVNSIRYKKDDLAAKFIDFKRMTKEMVGDAWGKFSAAEQKELVAGVEKIVRKISFEKGRDIFKHLDALRYDAIKMDGDKALCRTTVVVHKKVAKRQVAIEFVLAEDGGTWKIVDTVIVGQSTAEGIREDEIEPLMEEGGTAAVMKALRNKVAEVSS